LTKRPFTNWECNATVPAIRYTPAILRFLGYDPFPQAETFSEQLATVRKTLGWSQRQAVSLGVDPGTLQSWEAGQHAPTGRSVELVERVLATAAMDDHRSSNAS